jgi:hypothetical protein
VADAAEDDFLKPLLTGFAQQFVASGKITQEEADESVVGNMVDAKIALAMWLQGKQAPASNVPS